MMGFILGLGVSAILSIITIGAIWFARQIHGIASISIIQGGMLVKLMLGGSLTMLVIEFTNVDLLHYTLILGIYACAGLPLLSYHMVKQDCTTQTRIKQMGNGKKIRVI